MPVTKALPTVLPLRELYGKSGEKEAGELGFEPTFLEFQWHGDGVGFAKLPGKTLKNWLIGVAVELDRCRQHLQKNCKIIKP